MSGKDQSKWIRYCGGMGLIAVLILLGTPRDAHSGEIVSLSVDTSTVWRDYDQGWQAYQRDDWVEAYGLLARVWPLYLQLRNIPGSPFPQAPQFFDDLNAALQHARGELFFWMNQFPEQSRREYADLGKQLAQCRSQLSGIDRSYSFELPGVRRPPKPALGRVPPPGN